MIVSAIVLAAGNGKRMGADIPKQYIEMLKAAFQYQLDYLNKAADII